MVTSRISRMSLVVSLHPKTGLIVPVAGLHELGVFLEIAVLRSHMAATIAYSTVYNDVFEVEVLLVLRAQR